MRVEEQFEDVLKSIETAILQIYRKNPSITDYNVMQALDASIVHYKAAHRHQPIKPPVLNASDATMFQAIQQATESWLAPRTGENQAATPPLTFEDMLACLKRLRKSVDLWNKEGGRQGYLTFAGKYV